jgi:D-arabinose 1-dehydrogenase-like Zn-dependent alcohol dehydrogenase
MAKMKAVQVPQAGADFELVEREIPEPGSGHVRIHVQACGICHSDVITKEGLFPGMSYPRVPGRSVILTIASFIIHYLGWQAGNKFGSIAPDSENPLTCLLPRNAPSGISRS